MKTYLGLMGMPPERADVLWKRALDTGQFVPEASLLGLLARAGFEDIEPFYRGLLAAGWTAHLR